MLEKFAAKNSTCVAYDDKLQFYSNLANEVKLHKNCTNILTHEMKKIKLSVGQSGFGHECGVGVESADF